MNIRRFLPTLAFDRPVTVWVGFLALLVLGVLASLRIPVQLMPGGLEPKFLFVMVPYQGGTPLETDDRVVAPFSEQLSTVSGLKSVRSTASTGQATFFLQFWGASDMDEAYNAVSDRLERARADMPDDVDQAFVFRFSPDSQPIMWVGGRLGEEVEDPFHLLERVVKPRLERIPGVASVDVYGVPQNLVAIEFHRDRLFALGVDLGEVIGRLRSDNFQLGAGAIEDEGRVWALRGLSNLEVDELGQFPVKDSIVLSDIADLRRGGALSSNVWRVDGEEAAALAIKKESGANTQAVCADVEAAFAELEADSRVKGTKFHVFFNQGDLIGESMGVLTETALTGGLFAVVILYVFLREWKMTLLIATSIPLSLLLTVAALYFQGMDLNVLSLMGLMLAVGMVVDNAIVVIETIQQHRASGEELREAAIAGTAEVNLAILASTATTMVVFLPVMLMSENAQFSVFMKIMGMPVVLALGASLITALVVAPLATRYMGCLLYTSDAADE